MAQSQNGKALIMEMTLGEQEGIQVITLEGKLMGGPEDEEIAKTLDKFVDQTKIHVILDLTKVTWMNSSGLGMCLGGLTRMRNRGGDLRLVGMPAIVESLMDRCRILPLFQSYKSIKEAVESF